MTAPIPLEEAWKRLFALVPALGSETVPVEQASGRYLAGPLAARRTQPAADLSVMDGFAIAGTGPWRIVGEARAGAPYAGTLAPGEASAISTGAACPQGTDGIVPREDGAVDAGLLTASQPEPGKWIRRRGFDFVAGAALLDQGSVVGPAQLALARAAGHGTLRVARRPLVSVIECGDELVADPEACPPGHLPASNGAMVAAMAAGVGARTDRVGPLADNRATLADAIRGAAGADVIVTTAGASVGDHDHARGALADCGAGLAFWRVAIRPGKPLMVGTLGRRLVLGLPGNPASSFVTAWLFLLPLLRAMQGARDPLPTPLAMPLAEPLPAGGDRREFVRGQLRDGRAIPLPERDSSSLRTLAAADVLIDRGIGAPPAAIGSPVDCFYLGNGGIA